MAAEQAQSRVWGRPGNWIAECQCGEFRERKSPRSASRWLALHIEQEHSEQKP